MIQGNGGMRDSGPLQQRTGVARSPSLRVSTEGLGHRHTGPNRAEHGVSESSLRAPNPYGMLRKNESVHFLTNLSALLGLLVRIGIQLDPICVPLRCVPPHFGHGVPGMNAFVDEGKLMSHNFGLSWRGAGFGTTGPMRGICAGAGRTGSRLLHGHFMARPQRCGTVCLPWHTVPATDEVNAIPPL